LSCYQTRVSLRVLAYAVLVLAILAAGCSSEKSWGATPHKWTAAEQQILDAYMANEPVKRLQVGAGRMKLEGWLNTDIEPQPGEVFLDAGVVFPFPDKTFKYVYGEQVIEHLTYQEAQVFVRESFRVLAPGGRIRLATPDLLLLIALFNPEKTPTQKKVLDFHVRTNKLSTTPLPETAWFNRLNHAWGHQFLYDPQSLTATLDAAGFTSVTHVKLGESDAPDLQNIEMHWHVGGKEIDEATSQFVEATRP
jgi:predicted SAM-dependent methyltransferase